MVATPVTDVSPQMLDKNPSALCTIGRPPLVMTGSILWILRRHFGNPAWIVDEDLKDYVWTDNTVTNKIAIEPITKWPGEPTQALQRRPAVYVKRNTYGRVKLGIGDKYQMGAKPTIDKSVLSGDNAIDSGTMYGVILAGSHTVFCIGGTGSEAEAVGTEVFFELLEFSPVIRKDLGLNKFYVMEIGGISKLEESHEHWVVPVTVTYAFNHDWALKQDLPLLKTISLTAS